MGTKCHGGRYIYIQLRLKTWLWGLAARLFKWIAVALSAFPLIIRASSGPFNTLGRLILRLVILPIYRLYLANKKGVSEIVGPRKNLLLLLMANRYLVHGTIILIAVVVSVFNFRTRSVLAEDLSQRTILAQLLSPIEELIIESGDAREVESYDTRDQSTAVATESAGIDPGGVGDIDDVGLAGGTALIKPNITLPDRSHGAPRTNIETYIVQDGDTLGSIASRFNLSINTILWENNLSLRSLIRPGDKITILPVDGIRHKIKRGETLGSIAKRYDVSEEAIAAYNVLSNPSLLAAGEQIIIPGGKQPKVVVPRTTAIARGVSGQIPPSSTALPGAHDFIWPTLGRRINQYFNLRHHGIDIDNNTTNDPIYAAADGRIEVTGWSNRGYGNHVVISHGNGIQTLYGHLKTIYVKHGQQVTQGQTIGIMGTTGRSTGVHLHFEVRVNNKMVNPFNFY